MIGGWRRMLLVLTLVLGVLGMHALVLVPTAPAVGEQWPPPAATAPAAAHEGSAHTPPGARDAMATAALVVPAADKPEHGAGHGSMPSSTHQVLHLCLAVLAALLVLGLAALVLWPARRPDHRGLSTGALVRRVPRRRPPPTSVRLAQLCVLRN